MRKMLAVAAGAVFVAALSVPSFASEMTVKGEVVDIACATSKGEAGHGDGHAACAMSCAKRGQPAGIMTADAIYVITGDYAADKNAKLLDFVAKSVVAKGDVVEKDGQKMINITSLSLAK
ncbi:MAG: hypothetical protein AB7H88_15060 [Vicinamibacterales bacterium]